MGLKGCAICCMLLSVWGVIQLSIMGILYKMEAFIFIEDVAEEKAINYNDFIQKTEENYKKTSTNCFIAAGIYIVVFFISFGCMRIAKFNEKKRATKLADDDIFCAAVVQ